DLAFLNHTRFTVTTIPASRSRSIYLERAAATIDSAELRDSYLALAIQFERMADVLEQGEAARPDPRALKLDAVGRLRDLDEQNHDIGADSRRLADQIEADLGDAEDKKSGRTRN